MEGTGEGGQPLVSFPASSVQPPFATVRCLGLSFLLLAMVSHFLGSSGGAFCCHLFLGVFGWRDTAQALAVPVSGCFTVSGKLVSSTSSDRRPLYESQWLSNMTSGIKDHIFGFKFQKEIYSLVF